MKHKTSALIGTFGLAVMLVLTGCTASEDPGAPEPTVTTPADGGASVPSEPNGEELVVTPFETTVPEDMVEILSPLEGEWYYQKTSQRVQAVSNSFDKEMLARFVAKKEEEGWTHQFDPQINESSYVVSLKNEIGNALTIVGLVSGAADDEGGENAPASVITFVRDA